MIPATGNRARESRAVFMSAPPALFQLILCRSADGIGVFALANRPGCAVTTSTERANESRAVCMPMSPVLLCVLRRAPDTDIPVLTDRLATP